MKKLLVLALALVITVPIWAQQCSEVIVRPVVAMATIDSIRTIVGSKIIEMRGPTGNRFESVVIGNQVWGIGIPWGTTVVDTVLTDSLLTLSNAATVTDTSGSTITGRAILNFGYFGAGTYTDGDFVGIPFEVPLSQGKFLTAITLIDSADCADSLDIVFFNGPNYTTSPVRDTMPATFAMADYNKLIAIVKLRTMTDFGAVRIIQEVNLNVPVGSDKLYGRLVSRKAAGMLFTTVSPFLIRFKFY